MKDKASVSMALIAIAISVISILLALASIIVEFVGIRFDIPAKEGATPFALWVYSVIIAIVSLFFHILYAALSVIDIYLKNNPVLNLITVLLIFGAIPMMFFAGSPGGYSLLWNLYYTATVTLEILTLVKGMKRIRARAAEKEIV